MAFRVEDDFANPDEFIGKALDAKIESLDRDIARAAIGDLGRLTELRETFARKRSMFAPRVDSPKPAEVEPIAPPPAESLLPSGAIPQPRKYATAKPAPRPAPRAVAAPASQSSGMTGFLKNLQSQTVAPPPPQAAEPVVDEGMMSFLKSVQDTPSPPPPAAPPLPGESSMMGFLKNVQSQPAPAAPPRTAMPSPPPAEGGGQMLSYLQKMKSGEKPLPVEKKPEAPDKKEGGGELQTELKGLFDEIK